MNYWQWVASWAGYDRERAFRQWQDSGYADVNAHKQFIAAYELANHAGRQQNTQLGK